MTVTLDNLEKLRESLGPMLRAARIPGAGLAVVAGGETVLVQGYGYRDLEARRATTSKTIYPIGSTSKAFNATLIGMLVDEGKLAWDMPVQDALPRFRLRDSSISSRVTLRDLLTMRTGLPRHDWVWFENSVTRSELVERFQYLELSAGFRERFQYNNLSVTLAGHVAEVVTATRWEDLVQERILDPLGMRNTALTCPKTGDVSLSYHENSDRELIETRRFSTEVTAPSGGAIHSCVEDMACWILFNLRNGKVNGRPLIDSKTLAEIHAPQIVARPDPAAPTPDASYAMGWFVDNYRGRPRLSHGGYLHDVNSNVMLFPEDDIGIVSFINFGCPTLARFFNQYAFDVLKGFGAEQTVEEKVAEYEKKIEDTRRREAAVRRVENTAPSHPLEEYIGTYIHEAYGRIEIQKNGEELMFRRNELVLPLRHWHYDAWVVGHTDIFPIHVPHSFDRSNRFVFETSADGEIVALSTRLEPAVAPIRFKRL